MNSVADLAPATVGETKGDPMGAQTRRRSASRTVPYETRRRIDSLSRLIENGRVAMDRRAAIFTELHDDGYSLDAIATAAGITRENVRKAILRRSPTGYPGDRRGADAVAP